MAGSLRWFEYTTDTGSKMGIFMDYDWGTLVGNPEVTAQPANMYGIASNLTPRYALYRSNSGRRQLKIAVGANDASSATLPQTLTIDGTNGEISDDATDNEMYLSSLVGERYRPVLAVDTGMSEGGAVV